MSDLALYVADTFANELVSQQVSAGFAPWMDRTNFAGQCAIVAGDSTMRNADPESMVKALLKCGQMGLIPGPARHVSLILDGKGMIQVRPEFRGWQYVWEQAGWEVTAHIVHNNDTLEIEAIGPDEFTVKRHEYDPFGDRTVTDKTIKGGYVKGRNRQTGEVKFGFVPLAKILSSRSKAQTQNIWNAHFAEMVQKTLVHVAASRGWFPTPAAIAAAMQVISDADHEAAGVVLDRNNSKPTVSNVAQRIAAAAAPKALTVDATEPTGFADASDRKAFMAELGKLGWKYDDVAAWCEGAKRPRPSAMTVAQRVALLDYLLTDAGKAKAKAWLEARSASVRLADPDPAPLPDSQPERAAEGKPVCPKCGQTGGEIDRALGECSLCGGL